MADSGEGRVGRFHPECSSDVVLSEDRRVANGKGHTNYVFSNDPIPIGLQFSVKILQKGFAYVSSTIDISMVRLAHPEDLTHQPHLTRLEVLCM